MKQPSQKQLDYLKRLGYTGPPPGSSSEASHLIDALKAGKTSAEAERSAKGMRQGQARKEKQRNKDNLTYLAGLESMMRDSEGEFKCAGFRLKKIKDETPESELIYDKAFLPFDTAKRFPDLLSLNLEFDELERTPTKGNIVSRPGVIKDMEKVSATGCMAFVAAFIISVACSAACVFARVFE
jgi:hypothetical protein